MFLSMPTGKGLVVGMLLVACSAYGSLNVRDFGAVGDGRHDDTAALQRAADALTATGERQLAPYGDRFRSQKSGAQDGPRDELVFPKGIYRITSPVFFRKYAFVRGEEGAEIVQQDVSNDVFFVVSAWRCRFEGLTFRGGHVQLKLPTTNSGSASLHIAGCRFFDASGSGIECRSWAVKHNDRYRPVCEWKLDDASGRFVRNPLWDGERRPYYNSTLFIVEDCVFDGCICAADFSCDGSVMRNCRILSSKNASDGLMCVENVLNAYGLDVLIRQGDSVPQCVFNLGLRNGSRKSKGGHVNLWLEDVHIRTENGRGVQTICMDSKPAGGVASSIFVQDMDTESPSGKDRSIIRCLNGNIPPLLAIRNVRERSPGPIAAVDFGGDLLTEKMLEQNRLFKNIPVDRTYCFSMRGCSSNILPPASPVYRRFMRNMPDGAGCAPFTRPVAPRRVGPRLLAVDYGVDDKLDTDDTESLRRFIAALSAKPGSIGVLPPVRMTVSDTLELSGDFTLASQGTAALRGLDVRKDIFRVKGGASVTIKGIMGEGGCAFTDVASGGKAFVESCFLYNQEGPVVRTAKGADVLLDGGIIFAARVYEGEGRAFIGPVWFRFTPVVAPAEPLAGGVAFINKGELQIWDLLGVPCVFDRFPMSFAGDEPKRMYDFRWVDNYGRFYSRSVRYGGEWGGIVPVCHYGNAQTSIEGSYAWFWGRSIPQAPVVSDVPSPDARLFNVVCSGYSEYLPKIEMLYGKDKGRLRPVAESGKLVNVFPADERDVK